MQTSVAGVHGVVAGIEPWDAWRNGTARWC